MKEKVVTYMVPLALLFIIISFVQLCSIGLAEANSPPGTPSIPSGATSGSSGTFNSYVTKATDPDGDQVKYTFDWGDGIISTTCLVNQGMAVKVFHKWAVASGSTKTFSVRAKATDKYGAASSWSNPLSITISGSATVNNPPATPSVPSGSTSGSSGTSYSYSTRATDPDGNNVKYTFDWGDGTKSTTSLVSSGASASASHIWTVASGLTKTFSVSAKAVDASGAASSSSSPLSVTITGPAAAPVNNPPATPSVPSGSTSGSSGTSYSYSTKATDPDGNNVKYTFDWGDGTTSTTSLVSSGTSARASHIWSVASGSTKTFSVRAKAEDESGTDSSWSSSLSVTITGPVDANDPPAAPSVPSGSTSGSSGTSYSYSTKATDPDGDQIKYTFNWGDGTTSTTSLVSSGTAASASHSWNAAGTYSVKAMATDSKGATSTWSGTLTVSVTGSHANQAPYTPCLTMGHSGQLMRINYVFTQQRQLIPMEIRSSTHSIGEMEPHLLHPWSARAQQQARPINGVFRLTQ